MKKEKIVNGIKEFFRYISLADKKGHYISLTNLLMMTVIYKVMRTPVLSVPDLVLLTGALFTYIHRRGIEAKQKEKDDEVQK
jgi:hypothetical protein